MNKKLIKFYFYLDQSFKDWKVLVLLSDEKSCRICNERFKAGVGGFRLGSEGDVNGHSASSNYTKPLNSNYKVEFFGCAKSLKEVVGNFNLDLTSTPTFL